MFDEMEFKKEYKKAYDRIIPDQACIGRLAAGTDGKKRRLSIGTAMKTAAAVCVLLCLLIGMTLPVMAKNVPAIYDIVAKYVPNLADYVIPEKKSSTSQGITMQVEAVRVEDKTAEILVSFSDADGSGSLIGGRVDLYDSYDLRSYDSYSDIGGCSFLEYDAAEKKAYFKIDVSTFGEFDHTRLTFSANQLLLNYSKEERQIALDDVTENPAKKAVTLSGESGALDSALFSPCFGTAEDDSLRKTAQVMSLSKADAGMAKALTVTGIGYSDGILRVQLCRGNFEDADRHALLWVEGADGEKKYCDRSVSWQEETEGETLLFDEDWFLVDESELEDLQLYGTFWNTDGSVKGNWEVTLQVSP